MGYEHYQVLIDLICSECHVAIMKPSPNEYLADRNWYKCPICGFEKKYVKQNKQQTPDSQGSNNDPLA